MRLTTILFWQVMLVLLAVLLGIWAAAQWTAGALGHSPWLGEPWFFLGDEAVYSPWSFFFWWYAYGAYAPDVFDRGGVIASSGGFLGLVVAVVSSALRARQSGKVTTFGSARWASRRDLRRAGLLINSGVFLGQVRGAYLRHAGPEHVMAFAPTRSGKGVGLVVPTLLSWPHSAVVHDIKGENWSITAGWRAGFSRCLRFDPTSPTSARFNPLMEVRLGEHEVRDVQNIADILVDPDGALTVRNHWQNTAFALLVAAILHVLYAEEDKSLRRVAELLTDPNRPVADTLALMMQTNHLGSDTAPRVHPVIASLCREALDKVPNERSGVISTALSFLSLYRDPVVAAATSVSDFAIADLVEGERPLSLFLAVPPSDLSRTRPLMRLVLNQIGRRLTEELPAPGRRQVLLMLDEFPALGRLDFFETSLSFMAGYGLRAVLIAQSLNQVEKAYGPANSILDNCHVRVAFATNDERTARRISDALGTKTELRAMKNFAGHRLAPWLSHTMVSRQETARQLLTPGEVMQLPANEEIVLVSGAPPVKAKKLRYYADQNFTSRLLPPPHGGRDGAAGRLNSWSGRRAYLHEGLMPKARGLHAQARAPELGQTASGGAGPRVELGRRLSPDAGKWPRDLFEDGLAEADAFDHLTGTDLLSEDGL
jgi:type IV secretion system protein VirD4